MAATDITEVKQAEAALRRSNALLAAVHHAQDHFIGETNPLEIFAELLDEMLSMTGSEYGFVGQVLRTPEGRPYLKTMAITNIAWNDESRKFYQENAPDKLEFHNLETLFGAVLKTGQPVIANDPASDPRSGGLPDGHPPLRAFLGMPFGKGGEIVGMAGIANRPGGYDAEVLDFLRPLTATAANLIVGWRSNERRRQAEEAMMAATEAAEFANRSKSEFLANMSHELRTPLNAIMGFAQMIKSQSLGAQAIERYLDYADNIFDSGGHLLAIIDDILDLSKVDAGKVELDEREFDFTGTLKACETLIRGRANVADVALVIDGKTSGLRLIADERLVKQMLLNLISNAIKFTPPGGRVTLTVQDAEDDRLAISVADTGIGMVAKDIAVALSPFGQIEGAMTRGHEGTGLGLPIVAALAELHGGNLEIQSEVGVGTKATVWLPKERVIHSA
jgi:signal transduction histidine kinase